MNTNKQTVTLSGRSRIYAVFGDPVAQVQTPQLINPLFAAAGIDIVAVPVHATAEYFAVAWDAFTSFSNTAGIGVTVPHKIAAAKRCDSLTETARAVGAVNAIRRDKDGRMHGALFDGIGFVQGLGASRSHLAGARVLMIGAGGAGRAIAHALAFEGVAQLAIADSNPDALAYTINMVNTSQTNTKARTADLARAGDYNLIINASPIGLKGDAVFPVNREQLHADMLIADIAALEGDTALLRWAKAAGCMTADGKDMLRAQIALIAGFTAGLPEGEALGASRFTPSSPT